MWIRARRSVIDDELGQAVTGGDDLRAGVANAATVLQREYAIDGLQWWSPAADGASLRVELSCGDVTGPRTATSVGAAGTIILVGVAAAWVEPAVARLAPLVHHRWISEQLAKHVTRLARRNEALEDFAALLAHDVKSSLVSALRTGPAHESLSRTLELVDSILQAARADGALGAVASLTDTVPEAVADLGDTNVEVITSVTGHLPLSPAALRYVLRNLLTNAVAAGARTIQVSAVTSEDRQVLAVADDGVGLASSHGYASGTQLGIALCRRLLARFGGTLILEPRGVGTRAAIVFTGNPE